MAQLPASSRSAGWTSTGGCLITVGLLLAGCGGGPQFGSVSGRVTLDGQPLAETTVEFQPTSGSPSYGVTDADGYYTLAWSPDQPGAQVGEHHVRITSFNEGRRQIPERVPARYNQHTELVREVKGGSQKLDFELQSTGKK